MLSGIAMAVAGTSRPCSGACHEISHAIDRLFPEQAVSHGEQVGLGAAFATFLRGDEDAARRLGAFLRRHGLPVVPADIGLDVEQFTRAVLVAPTTRPGRYTILEHLELGEAETGAVVPGTSPPWGQNHDQFDQLDRRGRGRPARPRGRPDGERRRDGTAVGRWLWLLYKSLPDGTRRVLRGASLPVRRHHCALSCPRN